MKNFSSYLVAFSTDTINIKPLPQLVILSHLYSNDPLCTDIPLRNYSLTHLTMAGDNHRGITGHQ